MQTPKTIESRLGCTAVIYKQVRHAILALDLAPPMDLLEAGVVENAQYQHRLEAAKTRVAEAKRNAVSRSETMNQLWRKDL